MEHKKLLPPFSVETAKRKIKEVEEVWNGRNPDEVCMAYTLDTLWRNRNEFINGREEVRCFLKRKWDSELDYKLKKEYWAHSENRIAVRFEYEYRNDSGCWFRAYGNENWEFDENGLVEKLYVSINDLPIKEAERIL